MQVLDKFILRTPLKPFKSITGGFVVQNVDLKTLVRNNLDSTISDALYIASPMLYNELLRWLAGDSKEKKEEEKLFFSLLKYFSRMETRCTPFGLFAGCGIGNIDTTSNIVLSGIEKYKRHTRLDMNYMCALSQDLSNKIEVRQTQKYFPNSSLYKCADKYRYVEYHYEKTRRLHRIVSIDKSEYIELVINKAKVGVTVSDLVEIISNEEISKHDALMFINELINSQVIVGETEPSTTGLEHLDYLSGYFQNKNVIPELKSVFEKISDNLHRIDKNGIGNPINQYEEVVNLIEQTGTIHDIKYLFQTDMFLTTENNMLSKKIPEMVLEGVNLLLKINRNLNENTLQKFKSAFSERYEEQEIPLSSALDPDIGIGYPVSNGSSGDLNPLVDDLFLPGRKGVAQYDFKWNVFHSYLFKIYREALEKNKYEVEINEEEINKIFKDYPITDKMSNTFSAMIKVLESDPENDSCKIEFRNIGGTSGAYLLGRFCHGDSDILELSKQITDIESELAGDSIIAEIVHLPESRTGNVILRPTLREYEIPYLARPSVEKDFQISIDDLYLTVRANRLVLRSKNLNKTVIPRLTNAHNFSYNALPIYRFLCDLQGQDLLTGVGFSWGELAGEYQFLPRVIFKNIVFSPATWNVLVSDMKIIFEEKDDEKLIESVNDWRHLNKIPQWILLAESDNELFIDLDEVAYIHLFWNTVKKKHIIQINEFLFNPEKPLVKGPEGWHTNEIILLFKNGGQI